MRSDGATRIVAALERLRVEVAFGLPGVHNLALWRAIAGSGIRLIGVRHEQAAVHAADGYARASGRLGVALVTTGPGAANTLGATGEAWASGVPVLVIATDIASTLRREGEYRGALHECRDQAAMFAPVTKAAVVLDDAGALGQVIEGAGRLALRAPSRPVYAGVPTDLLTARDVVDRQAPLPVEAGAPDADDALLARALELIAAADRPLVWAGGGALRAGAGAAVALLAERLVAPVLTTYQSRGLVPPGHPCAVPGPVHSPRVGPLWDEADLVVAIGTDFDGMMTQNWAMPSPPRLVAVNVDEVAANVNYPADVTLVGDAEAVTARLADAVAPREGLAALAERLAGIGAAVRESVEQDEPAAARLLDAVARALPPEAVVVADMCIPGYWLAGFHAVPAPRRFAYPVGWGTLGYAFPAAIGAALAGAGPAVCFCGDGGFLFACGELATVAQERPALTVVLFDDGGYGMLRFDQLRAGDAPFGVDLRTPDFAALAASFGVHAERVNGVGDGFAARLAEHVRSGEPSVLVVEAALRPPPTTSPRWYRIGARE